MTYPKTEAKVNFTNIDKEITKYWEENNTFKKVTESNKKGDNFILFDGPATPSSIPHMGHLGVSSMKDLVCRYNNMLGKKVIHKLGWDVHGLPTEVMVEKSTGKQTKELVSELGIEKFCDMCRNGVMKYVNEWKDYLKRIGRWVEIEDDKVYNTMNVDYMESVIWALKKLYDNGLLYKDFKVNPYDWALGTIISNSEASSEYQDIIDETVTVWFELEDKRRILAWTTTPWTLPANSALAINKKLKYSVFKKDGIEYIVSKGREKHYSCFFEKADKIKEINGSELVGLKYKPLFDYYIKEYNNTYLYTVINADYVSDTDGTGIVHIAPAFGEIDYIEIKKLDLNFPIIVNVDDYGNFTKDVLDFAGLNIFEANPLIINKLKEKGNLVQKENHKHSYPFSPRSKKKLIYRATSAWYINVPKIKEKLIKNNKNVDWKSAGNRFESWIENARPWGISRNRFWGVPLPIWTKDDNYKVFGSIKELEEFFEVKITDLHRATLDKLKKDGWERIPDVLDAWFESGSMPFAYKHYPFENKEEVENIKYKSDYIVEGQDQTRGWFYTLMVLSTALFDREAFKTISANGHLVDENKKKLSKSLGNYSDPIKILDTYGADSTRLYLLGSNFLKAEPVPIDKGGKFIYETTKTILSPLWSAYHFFSLYANASNITAKIDSESEDLLDKYILEELNLLEEIVHDSISNYKPDVAIREFVKFLDILNNWYIRRNRERFWNEDIKAFNVLYKVLIEFCKLLAPFAPFISEYIYKNLVGTSVFFERFDLNKKYKKTNLLDDMRKIQTVISVGKLIREKYKLRNRLPISKITIVGIDLSKYSKLITDELNVKEIEYLNDIDSFAESYIYLITPKIGSRLGSKLKDIIPAVKKGKYKYKDDKIVILINNEEIELNSDEFEIRLSIKNNIEACEVLPDNTAIIIMDTNISKELYQEGIANDILRFIQETRKNLDLDVSDRINLKYSCDSELSESIIKYYDKIKKEALVINIEKSDNVDTFINIEDHKFGIKIEKIK